MRILQKKILKCYCDDKLLYGRKSRVIGVRNREHMEKIDFYQDRVAGLLKELSNLMSCNFNEKQIEKMNNSLYQFTVSLQNVVENISTHFLDEEMKSFIDETKANEKLSQEDFEEKYSYEIEVCRELGRAGWGVSEHSNPREVKEWYDLLSNQEETKIVSYFEENNGNILRNIFRNMEHKYCEEPSKKYFSKAKYYFEQEDYMTSAMYLVALIEARTNKLMNYPKKMRYT